jgi:hypothetical protein
MIEKFWALILLTMAPVLFNAATAYASSADHPTIQPFDRLAIDYISPRPQITTETCFSEEEIEVAESIPFETEYVDDPESEIGTEKILQEGVDGRRTEIYLVKYWRKMPRLPRADLQRDAG